MRSWIFGVVTIIGISLAGPALACPTGADDVVRPNPRPVVQNVSFQASEMIERASRLESSAASHEQSARSLEQEANMLANRMRALRSEAALVNASERVGLLDLADELQARMASDRSDAANERAQASELRMQARALRDRAVQLVRLGGGGNGGGWRKRALPLPPTSTPSPSERGIVL